MSRHGYVLWIILLGLAASMTLACGNNPQRQALSVTISPPSADAQNGKAQFTATGTYNTPPMTVTPLQANWAVVDQFGNQTTAVSVNANGLAQCASGASGVYTVGAWVTQFSSPPKSACAIVSPFGNPCGDSILGTAQLTCP